jgi:hypothetical protein
VADKIYGSTERHWIILLLNDIVDPLTQWPMSDRALNMHIESKYKTLANNSPVIPWTKSNVKSYKKIESRRNIESDESVKDIIEIDSAAYSNLIPSTTSVTLKNGSIIQIKIEKEMQTYFDYEQELNEKRRNIKLLRPEFVPFVEREFKGLFA